MTTEAYYLIVLMKKIKNEQMLNFFSSLQIEKNALYH